MCDFSLTHTKSRPAKVADKLQTKDFGRGTIGFIDPSDANTAYADMTAVCVLPGTEIGFDELIETRGEFASNDCKSYPSKVAIFRQINKDKPSMHHDALELPDGTVILLTHLRPGQNAVVLQLPAKPKTAAEEKAQERLPVTA